MGGGDRDSVQAYIVNINLFVKGGPKSRRAALWVALRDGPTRAVENLPPRCLLMRFTRNMMYYSQASYCRHNESVHHSFSALQVLKAETCLASGSPAGKQ
ncbi:hypothetical protein QTP88_006979 [Uroleucon formosanum]